MNDFYGFPLIVNRSTTNPQPRLAAINQRPKERLTSDKGAINQRPKGVINHWRTALPLRHISVRETKKREGLPFLSLYPDPGSNRDGLPHWCLRPARLPIPPSGHSFLNCECKSILFFGNMQVFWENILRKMCNGLIFKIVICRGNPCG